MDRLVSSLRRFASRVLLVVAGVSGGGWGGVAWAATSGEAAGTEEFFERRIRPVLVEHCHECHSASSPRLRGGLRVDTAEGLRRGGDSGPVLVPGNPEASRLIEAIRYRNPDFHMPPRGRLPEAVVTDFVAWVKAGAPDLRKEAETTGVTAPASRSPEPNPARHWAFQPLGDAGPPAPPAALPAGDPGVTHPVDRFVVARLVPAGLWLGPEADRRTLIRRLSFDLLGLPPAPEEVEAFVADAAPEAWERLVERYLASPHYGERWGRWWLDLARYADTNGQDENKVMANAWRYRDWVIRAFNRDLPFDRFIMEQLAGDLLPAEGVPHEVLAERWTATGLLVLGPKMLAEQDKPKLQLDIVDEQIDVVSRAFLGLTVTCARCHDHKFDPVTTQEYYALAGIFRSTRAMENLDFVSKFNERPLQPPETLRVIEAQERLIADRDQRVRKLVAAANAALTNQPGSKLPENPRSAYPEATRRELESLEQERGSLQSMLEPRRHALAVAEERPVNLPVHIRGSHLNLASDPVPRGFLRVARTRTTTAPPPDRSGRLELARWITDPENPLTARVVVNRVWQGHFGEGLVRTPDNFGLRGEAPSHPELLDWLAREFIRGGWSVKALHRLLLTSRIWRQVSGPAPATDPGHRLWSRFPRQRLEAEMVRDGLLAVSGRLDRSLGGSLVDWKNNEYVPGDDISPVSVRRSVYLPIVRDRVFDALTIFDFASPSVGTARRTPTVVTPQALFLLNSPLIKESARALAGALLERRDLDDAGRVRLAYLRALARPPRPEETRRALDFVAAQAGAGGADRTSGWAALGQVLLAANEFLYRD